MPIGFPGYFAGRLAPLALDDTRRRIDPVLLAVTPGGLSGDQIDGVDFSAIFGLEPVRAVIRSLSAQWR